MYTMWCEWDMGHEGLVFRNEEEGLRWCKENPNFKEVLEEEDGETVEDIWGDLVGLRKLEYAYAE